MNPTAKRYVLAQSVKYIVRELRKGMLVFDPDELIPRILAVGRSRGTPDFEQAVKELLAILAKKIPSAEYYYWY
jgi:UDP-N-acetylglucosamine:LPS N-acetylglucosamine transferase